MIDNNRLIEIYINNIIKTTNKTYEDDLKNNREKLKDVWWRCSVKYVISNDEKGFDDWDFPYNHNGKSPRKIIKINGRNVYAEWNFSLENEYKNGHGDIYEELLGYLNEDFKTTITNVETYRDTKEYRKYMRETVAPKNKRIEPVENNLKEELIDE